MSSCCQFLCCCCPSQTPKTDIETKPIKSTKTKTHHHNDHILRRVHKCGIGTLQVIIGAVMITVVLWLLVRLPEPQVHVTGFEVEALTTNPKSSLIHYNFTIHNPDMFKSLHYDVLVLRITYPNEYYSAYGATINFLSGKNGIFQRPRQTTLLPNHTMDWSSSAVGWSITNVNKLIPPDTHTYIRLKFVVQVSVKAFNKVVAKRQVMRAGKIYFHKDPSNIEDKVRDGTAYIDPRKGLRLT